MNDAGENWTAARGSEHTMGADRRTISIRPMATDADIEAAIDLIERFHSEGVYRQAPFAKDRVRRTAIRFRDDKDRRLAAVAWRQDRPIGLVAGTVEFLIFAEMKQASIAILYVTPGGRGSRAAIKLERWFNEQARKLGAQAVGLHVTSGLHHNRTHQLARHLGYRLIGGNYLK